VPQSAEAVAEPRAALISEADGLQPRVATAPVIIIVGGLGASVQFIVLVSVAVLPHASVEVNVLVCDLKHPLLLIFPSLDTTVGIPHASVAVADPSAALIAAADGLQPGGNGICVTVIDGGVTSTVLVIVCMH
jgi:hypothetical protein